MSDIITITETRQIFRAQQRNWLQTRVPESVCQIGPDLIHTKEKETPVKDWSKSRFSKHRFANGSIHLQTTVLQQNGIRVSWTENIVIWENNKNIFNGRAAGSKEMIRKWFVNFLNPFEDQGPQVSTLSSTLLYYSFSPYVVWHASASSV